MSFPTNNIPSTPPSTPPSSPIRQVPQTPARPAALIRGPLFAPPATPARPAGFGRALSSASERRTETAAGSIFKKPRSDSSSSSSAAAPESPSLETTYNNTLEWLEGASSDSKEIAGISLSNPESLAVENINDGTMSEVFTAQNREGTRYVVKLFKVNQDKAMAGRGQNVKCIPGYVAAELACYLVLKADRNTTDLVAENHTFIDLLARMRGANRSIPKQNEDIESWIEEIKNIISPYLENGGAYVVDYVPHPFPSSFNPETRHWQQLRMLFSKAFQFTINFDFQPNNMGLDAAGNLKVFDGGRPMDPELPSKLVFFNQIEQFAKKCSENDKIKKAAIREYLCPREHLAALNVHVLPFEVKI